MKKYPVSAVIITKNEGDRISRTLNALQFCKEILVVDSGSSDDTVELSVQYGAKVIQQDFLGYGAQKNYGFSLATQPWILSLDADEEVTQELKSSIIKAINDSHLEGFYICRQNFFLGKPLKFGKESKDWLLRLFRNGKAMYGNQLVHEKMIPPTNTARLKGNLNHYTYKSWKHATGKMDSYAELGAQELKNKGKSRAKWLIHLLRPIYFLKHYLLAGNFLNGIVGWKWSKLMTYYHTKKYLLLNK